MNEIDDIQQRLDKMGAQEVPDTRKNKIHNVSSGPYALLASDDLLRCTGTFTVNLWATTGTGISITIKNAGVGVITVMPNGAETIDGGASLILAAKDSGILSDDSVGNWDIL